MGGKPVQVHVPYPVLLERLGYFITSEINPEVYLDGMSLDSVDPRDLSEIRDEFGKKGLTVTLHGPYMDLNPGSASETSRARTEETYGKVFGAIEHLRPRCVVLHAGYHERKYHGDMGLWLTQSLKTWPRFVKEAERLGTVIAAENIFDRDPRALKALVDRLDSPNFGVCIDSGHLNIFSQVDWEDWFSSLGPHIAEVHIHDNNGQADEHLPVGEGSIDFKKFFSLLGAYSKDPVYTIEPHGEEMMLRGMRAIERFLTEIAA